MRWDHSVPSNYSIPNPQTELVQCTRRGENATSRKKVLIRSIHLLYFLVLLFIDIIGNIRYKRLWGPSASTNQRPWLVSRTWWFCFWSRSSCSCWWYRTAHWPWPYWSCQLGTGHATKSDEFSEKFQGGGPFSIQKFILQILGRFPKKLQYSFPKMRGGVENSYDFYAGPIPGFGRMEISGFRQLTFPGTLTFQEIK